MHSSSSFLCQEEFNAFHRIDRKLYSLLVINLWRDPVESMQVMALWLWLEHMGFGNVVHKILLLPYILVNEFADEAIICLNCIHTNQISSSFDNNDIPLIQSLMEKEISLHFFLENQLNGVVGIAKIVNEVWITALSDIMQQVVERNASQSVAESQMVLSPPTHHSLAHHGLRHVGLGGGDFIQPRTLGNEVPIDDRTMFVTFSKGYPVQEWEIREFFTRSYGICIDYRVFADARSTTTSTSIVRSYHFSNGFNHGDDTQWYGYKVKFTINGKHVWARKFVPKHAKSSLLSPLPPSHLSDTSF